MYSHVLWIDNLAAFVAAFLTALLLTPVVRRFALDHELGDKPNGRRVHIRMIPHLGGIALVAGIVVAIGAAALTGRDGGAWLAWGARVLPAVALIVALGLVDDVKSLRAMQKLSVQIVSAALLVAAGYHVATGWALVDAIPVVSIVLCIAFFVGMSCAVNLIDGHDGLAAGLTAISGGAFAVLAALWGLDQVAVLSLAVVGACLGFLVFNMPPGRIYMGDTGSMFLGTALAMIACSLTSARSGGHTFLAACLIVAVPMLDVVLAITRRLALRSPLFRADSLHMHHVLQQTGFSPRQILAILFSMQVFLSALGIVAAQGFTFPLVIGGVFLLATAVVFFRMMIVVRATQVEPRPDIAPASARVAGGSVVRGRTASR